MKRSIVLILLFAVLTACDKESTKSPLQITATIDCFTKGIIEGSSFPDDEEFTIGVFINDHSGVRYDSKTYKNIPYCKPEYDSFRLLRAEDEIYLSPTQGYVTAYYPWEPTITDYTSIPIDIYEDWMYSNTISGVSSSSPIANVTMKHALAQIEIRIKESASFSGRGYIQYITIQSDNIAMGGILNASTGEIRNITGANTPIEVYPQIFLYSDYESVLIDFVPINREEEATITIGIDGNDYFFTIESFTPSSGNRYTFNIDVK